jgi:hypothetical protein
MIRRTLLRGAVTAAALCALGLPASAGIIVTEGDVAARGGRLLALSAADSPPGVSASGGDAAVPGGTAGQIAHKAATSDTRGAQTSGAPSTKVPTSSVGTTVKGAPAPSTPGTDLDAPPAEGWQCTPMPGGMQYCEPRGGTGAVEGAAGGGSASAEDAVSMAIDEGCGGSPSGGGVLSVLAALAALGAARLRRRDAV